MYKSPVDIFEEFSTKITEETDNHIVAEIEKAIGVSVDKDELIKAMNYDRNQYNQGYNDAKELYAPRVGKWKRVFNDQWILECPFCDKGFVERHLNYRNYCPNCGARLIESEGEE